MRRTILLADDSATIQRLVTQTFADVDVEVISVSNGEAAIRKFEEVRPHVVLADIYMPGKNGYEVCAYVKAHRSHSATPVILLVGAYEVFDEEKAKQSGAFANITKPFQPRALVELVLSLIPTLSEEAPERAPEAVAESESALVSETAGAQADAAALAAESDEKDLLGLEALFPDQQPPEARPSEVSDADVERIANRVIEKISSQVIESIAWEIVPDITEKVLREGLKRNS